MIRSTLVVLLALVSCAPMPDRPRTTPQPAAKKLAPAGTASRVVLVSFDGLSADGLAAHMPVPGFAEMQRDGASARVVPVNPTSTATTHASILTGAQPQRHGIVANRFHVPGTPAESTARGIGADLDAETLVEAARRQGKRVGAIPFAHVDGRNAMRRADFGIVWTPSLTQGDIVTLKRADFHREWVPPTWTRPAPRRPSFSPVMRARVLWSAPSKSRAEVDVAAYDTTDDRLENYDSYRIEVNGAEVGPDLKGWFAVSMPAPDALYGSWSKVLRSTPSLEVEIYRGPISATSAYPEDYRAMLDAEAGFWPGEPDEKADIDPQTFVEQMDRLAAFLTRTQTLTIERMDFDLLLAYQPQVDQAAHSFLGYDDSVMRAAFFSAGHAVERIRGTLDPAGDALVVVGDHGYAPVAREIRMNRLLADLGFFPRWRAWANGNVAHLYRFGEPADTAEVVRALTASGHFEKVESREPAWHRNSGDVIAWAPPATVLSPSTDGPALGEPDEYGQHGALNTHRELHTVLFASGAGVPAGSFDTISQTAIARFVSGLLGIQPPAAAE